MVSWDRLEDVAAQVADVTLWTPDEALRVLKLSLVGVQVDALVRAVGAEGAV